MIKCQTKSNLHWKVNLLFCDVVCDFRMRGITSQAMVMCASPDDRSSFELLNAPEGSVPGDRVTFDGFPGEPDKQLNPKRKVFVACRSGLIVL